MKISVKLSFHFKSASNVLSMYCFAYVTLNISVYVLLNNDVFVTNAKMLAYIPILTKQNLFSYPRELTLYNDIRCVRI